MISIVQVVLYMNKSFERFSVICFISLIVLSSFLFTTAKLSAQTNYISIHKEHIRVQQDSSFTRDISVTFHKRTDVSIYSFYYDIELEEVSEIELYIKKGNRFKLDPNPVIRNDDLENEYINSKKIISILLPPNAEVQLKYSIKCSELLYFSNLKFFSYHSIDSLKYEIEMPRSFHFAYDIVNADSLKYCFIDSLIEGNTAKWKVEVVPSKIESSFLSFFGIYENHHLPLMRTIVVPAAYRFKERQFLNAWYYDIIQNQRGLDLNAKTKIDELTTGINDPIKITETIYHFVQSKFKYVGIETGLGAFIPYHVNEVFKNKQGDCKDLSNFLSEALTYKGIKSSVALASTFNHISDCDFPSLSSTNHLICVVYINENFYILDPTDQIHLLGTPVQSLQDRSILIINSDGGEFYVNTSTESNENEISYNIILKADSIDGIMQGSFKVLYKGISGNFLKRNYLNVGNEDLNNFVKKYFERIFSTRSITDFNCNLEDTIINAYGNISVKGKIFNDRENKFLFIDFLPGIIENIDKETIFEGSHLGSKIFKRVKLNVEIGKSFDYFEPIEYDFSENDISLNFIISNPKDQVVECIYKYSNNHIIANENNIQSINDILKSFYKIINEPILLKSKD